MRLLSRKATGIVQTASPTDEDPHSDECPTFFPAQNGGRRARQRARGAIAAARVIALGVYASESLAFHRLLVVDIAHGICKALQRIPVFMAPQT